MLRLPAIRYRGTLPKRERTCLSPAGRIYTSGYGARAPATGKFGKKAGSRPVEIGILPLISAERIRSGRGNPLRFINGEEVGLRSSFDSESVRVRTAFESRRPEPFEAREAFWGTRKGVTEMLVLSRKPGERILIGDNVTVTIVRIGPNTVRLGIDAPRDLNIVREELCVSVPEGEDSFASGEEKLFRD